MLTWGLVYNAESRYHSATINLSIRIVTYHCGPRHCKNPFTRCANIGLYVATELIMDKFRLIYVVCRKILPLIIISWLIPVGMPPTVDIRPIWN